MSLETRTIALAQAIGAKIKELLQTRGTMSELTTADKTSLVNAINEVKAAIGDAGAGILDSAGDGDIAHTWSANKIHDELLALESKIINGAPEALNTLLELATELQDQDSVVAGLINAVGNKVDFAQAQALTTAQKLQACTNLGIGDPEVDLVAVFNTALV